MEYFALTLADLWLPPVGANATTGKTVIQRATPSFTDPAPGQDSEQTMTLKTCGKMASDPKINPVRLAD